ncbi:sulfite exporter TauE/SafE family protein [Spirulina subsalsa]|uniref:sulfite exporter TauE/SafE family protein n=1 Tax=Spirulina subsalsa TaxID=54311 RepID=UPI0002FEFEDE|nr:sulfite exporter TauE/SafE family protein [Spirulina subsalsa]
MIIFGLVFASSLAWFISSLIGGGSPLVLIPVLSLLVDATAIPPIITVGMLFGNAQRTVIYWQEVDWSITRWYVPGGIVGSIIGAFLFSRTQIAWLSVLLALFLLTSVVAMVLERQVQHFEVKAWYFLPVALVYALLSGLIGSTGPVLHPFYLSAGLMKEQMLATKSLNILLVHLVKILAYGGFGVLTTEHLGYGIILGVAALPGNWLGQRVLKRISDQQFRRFAIAFVACSGMFMLWQQRTLLGGW